MNRKSGFQFVPFDEYRLIDELEAGGLTHFDREASYELLGEISRSSAAYVQWVQLSLNKILSLQLKVDGISGTQTRSAIRSFQRKRGLKVDGIVGPQTEAALIAAGASRPPGSIQPPSSPQLPSVGPRPLTYSEVRSTRIDVDAQRSLLRMSNQGDTSARADARGLSDAVRDGRLQGIYAENQEVPAKLAVRLGTSWWKLIPGGENAALILEPGSPVAAPPTIAFREKLRSQPLVLDAALRKAWQTFRLLRDNKLVACPVKTGALIAEIPGSSAPVSNLVPPILCTSNGGDSCKVVSVSLPAKESLRRPTMRVPAKESLPRPRIRPCCILAPTLSLFNSDSNIADPANLGNHRAASEARGIIYSGKAGFLDLGHMRDLCDITKFVFDQMMAVGGWPSDVITSNGAAKFFACADITVIEIARAISLDDGLGHEIVSYDDFQPGMHNSAFSPEDLCSNFLGTLLAERAIAAGGSFDAAVDSELSKLLKSLDAQSVAETQKAFDLINGRWIRFKNATSLGSVQYLQRRNFSQVPFKAGHPSDSPTPSFVTTLLPDFSSIYKYTHLEGKAMPRSNYSAEVARIKVDAVKRYGTDFDKP